jgi:integrase
VSVFALAVDDAKLDTSPVVKAKRHKLENGRNRVLSFGEEDALRAALRQNYPEKEPEFDLALHLACRRSNLYGQHAGRRLPMEALQWSDVNLDFRIVTFKRSKSGKSYKVPINDTALAAFKKLRERSDGTGAVIRNPRPRKPSVAQSTGREVFSCRKWFETCVEKAGIEDFCYHDLRHTAATRLRAAGVTIEDIRYLLGHGAKSITERYAHPDIDLLRKAVANLDQTKIETDTAAVLHFKTA